jgi:uncharacterized membrane protein
MALLDPAAFIEGMFYAAAGIGLMLGVPAYASQFKGGLQVLAIAVAVGLFYIHDQGLFGF